MKKALNAIRVIMETTLKVILLGKQTLNELEENL